MNFYLSLFLLLFAASSSAQVVDTFMVDFRDFFRTGGQIATAPLSFQQDDWIKLSATLALTSAAYFADEEIHNYANRNLSNFNDGIFAIDRYYYLEFAAISIVGIYGYGLLGSDFEIRKLGYQLASATFYSSLITVMIKTATGRTRTEANRGHDNFQPFRVNLNNSSFPSAHTSLAFSFSTVMAAFYDNLFWKIGWYSAAALVGAARIYHDKHWLSDVLFGAAVGHFIADFVVHRNNSNQKPYSFYLSPFSFGVKYNL